MIDRLAVNLRMAASLFMTADERAARLLVGEKEVFRSLEAAATETHFDRLRAGASTPLKPAPCTLTRCGISRASTRIWSQLRHILCSNGLENC